MTTASDDSKYLWLALLVVGGVSAWRFALLAFDAPNLSFDEAQYWAWAQTIQLGYYSKPPVVAWAIAATTAACGEGEGCVKLSAALAHLATTGFLTLLAKELWGARVAAWVAVSWITLPAVSLSSMMITTDPFLLVAWSAALLCLVKARTGGATAWRWWTGLGVAIGFGLLAKYAMAFFLGCLALWLAWDREARPLARRPGLWGAIGLGLLIYSPNLIWNAANGFVSYEHTKDNAALGGTLFHPAKLAEFVAGQFAVFGPILMAGLVLALIGAVRPGSSWRHRMLASFTLPILAVMTAESLLSRANANWTAPSFVAGIVLVVPFLARRPAWLAVSLALHLTAAFGAYHYDLIRPYLGERAAKLDPERRIRGWDLVGDRVSRLLAEHPGARLLADERKVLATLLYYVHPHPFDAVKWNKNRQIRDHFDQTTSIEAGEKLMLYVTEYPGIPESVISRFEAADKLEEISIHVDGGGRGRPLSVWLLSGFKGY
jgi:4-amino-4-deoxy-L-arabinose transferase-like glycosyltransferase